MGSLLGIRVGGLYITTTRQGTMMEGTGQCGSYQCLGAQTHLRC
ncbi:hypothetical protein LINPERPRIM_LOCUS4771 [Linum perenne]